MQRLNPDIIKRIPNWITYFRLCLIPIFVVLMLDPTSYMVYFATFVFIIAAITDYVDGYIARRYGAVSDLGKLLDPLADKILVMAALVMLVAQRADLDARPWVPGWIVVMALAREIWVTGLRALAASRGSIVAASQSAKVKSGLQMVAIVFLLLHDRSFIVFGFPLTAQYVGLNLLFLSVIFSYWSGIDYTLRILSDTLPSKASSTSEVGGGGQDPSLRPGR